MFIHTLFLKKVFSFDRNIRRLSFIVLLSGRFRFNKIPAGFELRLVGKAASFDLHDEYPVNFAIVPLQAYDKHSLRKNQELILAVTDKDGVHLRGGHHLFGSHMAGWQGKLRICPNFFSMLDFSQ